MLQFTWSGHARLDVPRDTAWKKLTHYEEWSLQIAGIEEALVSTVRKNIHFVDHRVRVRGMELNFTLQYTHYPPSQLVWKLWRSVCGLEWWMGLLRTSWPGSTRRLSHRRNHLGRRTDHNRE